MILPSGAANLLWALSLLGAAGPLDVRPLQLDYPVATGMAGARSIVLWNGDGEYDEARVLVDGAVRRMLAGDERSAALGDLDLGQRLVEIEALSGGAVVARGAEVLNVVDRAPVPGVRFDACLFYAPDPRKDGRLELFWTNQDTPQHPYFDYEILVNGVPQDVLPAPRDSLAFTSVPPGLYRVEVVAYTRNYLCAPAAAECLAERVSPVFAPRCQLQECMGDLARLRVTYALPPGESIDSVAAFDVSAGGHGRFLQTVVAGEPVIVDGVSVGRTVVIELVALRGDSASVVPGEAGPHTQAHCVLPLDACAPGPRFLRGDADGSGVVELTDSVRVLGVLFLGGDALHCADAGDFDDSGAVDISDAVGSLGFLFLGDRGPAAPAGPICGVDPTGEVPDLGCTGLGGCI